MATDRRLAASRAASRGHRSTPAHHEEPEPDPGAAASSLEPADPEGPDSSDPPVETRRERQRRETVEEIKTAARQHVTLESTSQLSLRAVARDVGLTPSAIYRYFESQQELVGAVARDAFRSATEAMRTAGDAASDGGTADQLAAVAYAYREWARAHKAEFNLMFNTDLAGLVTGLGSVDTETLGEFFSVPLMIYAAGIGSGAIGAGTPDAATAAELAPDLLEWAAALDVELDGSDLGRLISAWSAFHGYVVLELFGHLDSLYADRDEAFAVRLNELLLGMGLRAA